LSTFVLGGVIRIICQIFSISVERRTSLTLLGTLKNAGTAAGIGLLLFGKTAALPAAVATTFMIIHFIWLGLKQQWQKKRALP